MINDIEVKKGDVILNNRTGEKFRVREVEGINVKLSLIYNASIWQWILIKFGIKDEPRATPLESGDTFRLIGQAHLERGSGTG